MTISASAVTLLALTLLLYLLASLSAFPELLRKTRRGGLMTAGLAAAGLLVHLFSLLQQGFADGRCPMLDRYATMSFLAWLVVLVYLIAYARSRMQVLSVILPPLALILLVTSNLLEIVLPPRPLPLGSAGQGSLFALHVTIAILGVAALFLTFASSLTYLLQDRILKSKQHGSWLRALPPLERCDRLVYQSLAVGFPLLTLGIVSGSILGASRTGHFWSWRVDEAFSLTAWIIFASIIWARLARGWRGRRSAYLTIAGFLAGLLTMAGMYL